MFYTRRMTRPTYHETECKSALNRVSGMPFAWSLNPYRGCVHACHYCYARATHAHLGMNADADFETRIVVKRNFAEVLRGELARPSWRREQVAVGTATDAWQPCEGRYRIARAALAALVDFRTPAGIVTKSTLVQRDLDLLVALQRVAGVAVNVTITTLDRDVWRTVEPGTPPPWQRLATVGRLAAAGVPVGVYLAPVLPGITDGAAAIDQLAEAAAAHGAGWLWAAPLRLAPLVKEHYLGMVASARPELLGRYRRSYPAADPPAAWRDGLARRVAEARERHGLADGAAARLGAGRPGRATAAEQLVLAI